MSGHVPKYGGSNGSNFTTEASTLARGGGKGGSGDSLPEESSNGPVYSGRGGASGGRGGTGSAPKRDGGSTRSSQEGSVGGSGSGNRPSPPTRRELRDSAAARTGVRGSQDRGGRSNNPPRNVNDEYAGAGHLPKFGEWNGGEGETNYTVMFSAASKERKTGVVVDDTPMKGSGDSYSNSSRLRKKQSSCWPCF